MSEEDMHGPLADTEAALLAMSTIIAALLAHAEREAPGAIGSVAKTADGIITTTLRGDPETMERAAAHVSRLAGQATRLVRRAEGL